MLGPVSLLLLRHPRCQAINLALLSIYYLEEGPGTRQSTYNHLPDANSGWAHLGFVESEMDLTDFSLSQYMTQGHSIMGS